MDSLTAGKWYRYSLYVKFKFFFYFRCRFSFRSALFSLPLFVTRTRSGFAVYTICECGMNSGTICALCNWFCGLILWNDIGASPPNEMICPRIACHPSWLGSKWEILKGRSRALCQSECLWVWAPTLWCTASSFCRLLLECLAPSRRLWKNNMYALYLSVSI